MLPKNVASASVNHDPRIPSWRVLPRLAAVVLADSHLDESRLEARFCYRTLKQQQQRFFTRDMAKYKAKGQTAKLLTTTADQGAPLKPNYNAANSRT